MTPLPLGHADYCKNPGPCSAGHGDCDINSECQSGLSCAHDVGSPLRLECHHGRVRSVPHPAGLSGLGGGTQWTARDGVWLGGRPATDLSLPPRRNLCRGATGYGDSGGDGDGQPAAGRCESSLRGPGEPWVCVGGIGRGSGSFMRMRSIRRPAPTGARISRTPR